MCIIKILCIFIVSRKLNYYRLCYHKNSGEIDCKYIYVFFFFDPRKVKSNEKKSVCSHQGYWICWKCVEQMIAQLPPRKNRLGLEAAARLAYITAIVAAFSRFSPLSVRGLSNEQSLRATKHSRRKCREHNHLKLLHFHLALRLPRRNT